MAKEDVQNAASWDPESHTSGGYLDDRDCEIIEAKVVEFDYNGEAEEPVCALAVTFRPDGGDAGGDDDRTEYYSVGKLARFTPSGDGKRAVPVSAGSKINNKSKVSLFMQAAKTAGIDVSSPDVGFLDGLKVHVNVVPVPSFRGKDGVEVTGKNITIITKLLDGKGDGKKAAPKANKPAAKTASKAAAKAKAEDSGEGGGDDGDDAVSEKAAEIAMSVLAQKDGKTAKLALPNAAFKAIKDASLRNKVIKLLASEAWLGAVDRPWYYADGELSLGGD
jgi:hypothetical protein